MTLSYPPGQIETGSTDYRTARRGLAQAERYGARAGAEASGLPAPLLRKWAHDLGLTLGVWLNDEEE